MGHGVHFVFVVFDQLAREGVLLIDDAANDRVNFLHGLLRHIHVLGDRPAQEDFALVLSVDHGAEFIGHAVAGHHVSGDGGGALKIVAGTGGHLIHEHFFGNPATEQHGDRAQHALFVEAVTVGLGELHRDTQRTATRDHRDLVDRVGLGDQTGHQGMTCLVIGGVAALLLGHDH